MHYVCDAGVLAFTSARASDTPPPHHYRSVHCQWSLMVGDLDMGRPSRLELEDSRLLDRSSGVGRVFFGCGRTDVVLFCSDPRDSHGPDLSEVFEMTMLWPPEKLAH